jgi:hypothetical protein
MGSLVTNPFGHLCLKMLLEELLGKIHCTINQLTHQPTNLSMILNVYKETRVED